MAYTIKITEVEKIGKHQFPKHRLYHFEPCADSNLIQVMMLEEHSLRFTKKMRRDQAHKLWTKLRNNGGKWVNKEEVANG
jgi:hypothetical protein